MLKKSLIFLGALFVILIGIAGFGMYYFAPKQERIPDFIQANPEKSAITLFRNDSLLINLHADRVMPLASTMKIIIAIEYAEQAAAGKINPDEFIPLSELAQYYVPNTDGGAHEAWLGKVDEKITDDAIAMREVAKGMIKYSSNANTEWLCDRLGLENINERIDSLELQEHRPIHYVVSALFVGKEKFPDLKGDELKDALEDLSMPEYVELCEQIHSKLKSDTIYKKDFGDLSMPIQRIWSDRLPASTTAEYADLMRRFNSREYFTAEVHTYLNEVMEWILDNPKNKTWLEHSGMKGGSTAFVLTKSLYATDKEGNTTELVYFFNDLKVMENTRLQISMNEFELNILQDEEFLEKVVANLGE